MKKNVFFFLLLVSYMAVAQDTTVKKLQAESGRVIQKDPKDTLPKIWRIGGLYNLNLAQGSLRNWAAGGDEFSLTITSILSLFAFYQKDRHSWDNTLDFNFGFLRTTSLGSRKNDDRFDIVSKYGYAISSKWNLSGLFNFRTQFFKGYTYSTNVKTFASAFLSPANILISPGFDYRPNSDLSIFISPVTARWVIVKNDSISAKGFYGVDPGEHSKFELGAFLTANYLKDINKVLTYKGRLDIFSNYRHNPQNVDLFFSNIFSVKLSNVLSASWNLDFIYDDDTRLFGDNGTSPALQVKSLVGVGLLVKFGQGRER
ncbi:DUF3078 domain-containing protein [Chitinophagaceae bacterium LB-8]|uniref:DUF3078 domain-containing protein n=1 Tax=Paraflavisolibacter caeni TaxID=2982496 RepID=A0A9X3BHV3_9BACT|nr:DUF3078 domain-containing protein [Paraflavisolibacter caeni]MCU7550237.1 DUF3078 domain-containing protein [Paraflavisolibacter caeni]